MVPNQLNNTARERDVLLRPLAVPGGKRHYLLVTIDGGAAVAGPFLNLGDAVIAAREIAVRDRIAIWHEQVDDKGRIMGPLLRLFSGV